MSDANHPIGANGNGNGRRPDGTFTPGHGHSRKPRKTRAKRLRQAVLKAVTEDDVTAIMAKQVELAKAGDPQAAKLVLERAIGKVSESDLRHRIEELEKLIQQRGGTRWN